MICNEVRNQLRTRHDILATIHTITKDCDGYETQVLLSNYINEINDLVKYGLTLNR